MELTGYAVVLVTASTESEAQVIANALLEKRKAACVNIIPHIASRFWWRREIDSAEESLLIIKTRASVVPDIIRIVKENHKYEVPEIIALPVMAGSVDYLEWINCEVKE